MTWHWILAALGAGLLSWWGTGWLRQRAERLNLVEHPNARSSHAHPTPSGGGLAMVLATLPLLAWSAWHDAGPYLLLLPLALAIALLGLWDDLRNLSQGFRLAVQAGAATGLLLMTAGAPETSAMALLAWAAALLAVLWWINLFNFMDGIDGLAASQAAFMLAAAFLAGIWHAPDAASGWTGQAMVLVLAASLGFLAHNWPPARIFMGDAGSTFLAFMMAALAAWSMREGWLTLPFWLILAGLFVADASVTLLRRMLTGQAWWRAHRSHAYQRLARHWQSHARVTRLAWLINLAWLLPLALASLMWPGLAWTLTALAYAPLLAGALALGAGREAETRR